MGAMAEENSARMSLAEVSASSGDEGGSGSIVAHTTSTPALLSSPTSTIRPSQDITAVLPSSSPRRSKREAGNRKQSLITSSPRLRSALFSSTSRRQTKHQLERQGRQQHASSSGQAPEPSPNALVRDLPSSGRRRSAPGPGVQPPVCIDLTGDDDSDYQKAVRQPTLVFSLPTPARPAAAAAAAPIAAPAAAPIVATPPSTATTPTSAAAATGRTTAATSSKLETLSQSSDDWTKDDLVTELKLSLQQVLDDHIRLVLYNLKSQRPVLPVQKFASRDWFADSLPVPEPAAADEAHEVAIIWKLATSKPGPASRRKSSRMEQVVRPIMIESVEEAPPPYIVHQVEMPLNILAPSTYLWFVPHLKDLDGKEEKDYRTWMKSLENMDEECGIRCLFKEDRRGVRRGEEWALKLSPYLRLWLERLASLGFECSVEDLVLHMIIASKLKPKAPESIPESKQFEEMVWNRDPAAEWRARQFTNAFNTLFSPLGLYLYGLLVLEENIIDKYKSSRNINKDTQTFLDKCDDTSLGKLVENLLESYSLLTCIVCTRYSCDHGEYGQSQARSPIALNPKGGLLHILQARFRKTMAKVETKMGEELADAESDVETDPGATRERFSPGPCKRQCFRKYGTGPTSRPPTSPLTKRESLTLRSIALTREGSRVATPAQCIAAAIFGRECWEMHREYERLGISSALVDFYVPGPPRRSRVVPNLPWYDRFKKRLIGDWETCTMVTHFQLKEAEAFESCKHRGPCNEKCPCVAAGVLCEKLCLCTAETCARKFTGCSCHGVGRACHYKQRDKCICLQLNRECDPDLCGGCGVRNRVNIDTLAVANRPPPAPWNNLSGCQNCALQQGVPRAVLLGKSRLMEQGYGLFAAEDIPANEFVIEYVGELISHDEGTRREARRGDAFNEKGANSYLFTLLEKEGTWVDSVLYGNLSRYINHGSPEGRQCNIVPNIVYVNTEYRIKFTALRDIKTGEELLFNYGEYFPNLTEKLLRDKAADKSADKEEESTKKKSSGKKMLFSAGAVSRKRSSAAMLMSPSLGAVDGGGRKRRRLDAETGDDDDEEEEEGGEADDESGGNDDSEVEEDEYRPRSGGEGARGARASNRADALRRRRPRSPTAAAATSSNPPEKGARKRLTDRSRGTRTAAAGDFSEPASPVLSASGSKLKKRKGRGGARPGAGRRRKHPLVPGSDPDSPSRAEPVEYAGPASPTHDADWLPDLPEFVALDQLENENDAASDPPARAREELPAPSNSKTRTFLPAIG